MQLVKSKNCEFFGIDKFVRLILIIRNNGDIFKCLRALYWRNELKIGTLEGEDKYGNRYYENNDYFIGCHRWIEYAGHVRLEYDASQVPVEWYGWLHYKADLLPYKDSNHPKYAAGARA